MKWSEERERERSALLRRVTQASARRRGASLQKCEMEVDRDYWDHEYILSHFPRRQRRTAQSILRLLCGVLSYRDDGTVIVRGEVIPGSNIVELIRYELQNCAPSWYRGYLCAHVNETLNFEDFRWRRRSTRLSSWKTLEVLASD